MLSGEVIVVGAPVSSQLPWAAAVMYTPVLFGVGSLKDVEGGKLRVISAPGPMLAVESTAVQLVIVNSSPRAVSSLMYNWNTVLPVERAAWLKETEVSRTEYPLGGVTSTSKLRPGVPADPRLPLHA